MAAAARGEVTGGGGRDYGYVNVKLFVNFFQYFEICCFFW
jgi:hypothetical protein